LPPASLWNLKTTWFSVVQETEDEMLYQAAGRYEVITDEGKTKEKQVAVCLGYIL